MTRLVTALACAVSLVGCSTTRTSTVPVGKWGRAELSFQSSVVRSNPFQESTLVVTFTSPSGRQVTVDGFWDGGQAWRVRFMPDEIGVWSWQTRCDDDRDKGLRARRGTFSCVEADGKDRFSTHGPVRVSENNRYLEHADGTPFFWLADTAWNGPLHATSEQWADYIKERVRQRFTAVQWVATQWRAAPEGDRLGRKAFTGRERLEVNPEFFQQLDAKAEALSRAGMLNVPVLLWAIGSGSDPSVNPGFSLPEDQAVRLARYMVARWQAHHVVWILPGDGDYRGERRSAGNGLAGPCFAGAPMRPPCSILAGCTGSGVSSRTSHGLICTATRAVTAMINGRFNG